MKRLLSLFSLSILFWLYLAPTLAQSLSQLEVKRSVNLRREPTTKANKPIELLRASEKLQLIDPELRDGYFHVRSDDGNEGWVWARNVRIVGTQATVNGLLPETIIATMPAGSGVAQHISSSWQKFVPKQSRSSVVRVRVVLTATDPMPISTF